MPHSDYTLLHAIAGGILIGLGSLLAAFGSGKLPGISGMFSRVLRPVAGDALWRLVFFAGLLAGAGLMIAFNEPAAIYRPLRSLPVVAVAGILVGFGTRLGGGCTSGHGVCGLGLGSRAALVATVTFMAGGIATVYLLHHTGLAKLVR